MAAQGKKKIWKNIILLSFAFLLLFTSYNSMSILQSSINTQVGTLSLSALYLCLVISCLFLPTLLITKLGEKKTIALCMLGYSTYIAAQFYPRTYTLLPGAIVVGVCAAPLWAAKCTYLTKAAKQYGLITEISPDLILNRFFGIFFLFFQSSNVWGNLITSTVLKKDSEEIFLNNTARLSHCGVHYCQEDIVGNSSLSNDVTNTQLYIMSSVFLIFSVASAVLVWLFLDPISRISDIEEPTSETSTFSLLISTVKHFLQDPYQVLLIPLTIWSGTEQAFLSADFTAAYVSCREGVYMVGYVIIVYGIMDAIGSLLFTFIVKKVGRVSVFTLAAILHYALIIFLFLWSPSSKDKLFFFVVAGLWGLADSIWQTQINAFYGVLFYEKSEAGFSNYRLWESIGFALAYLCSTLICVKAKLIMLLCFLTIGLFGYYFIEVNEKLHMMKTHRSGKMEVKS